MLGRHAGEHRDLVDDRVELLVGEHVEVGARQCRRLALDQTQLLADCTGCHGVVAGDHLHGDARLPRLGDCRLRLGPGRVDDADERQQHQVVDQLERCGAAVDELVPCVGGEVALGDGDDAHAVAGQAVVVREDVGAVTLHGLGRAVTGDDSRRTVEDHVRGALHEGPHCLLTTRVDESVERGHQLHGRVERNLGHPPVGGTLRGNVDSALHGEHDQGPLGGVTHEGPSVVGRVDNRVAAQRHAEQCVLEDERGVGTDLFDGPLG